MDAVRSEALRRINLDLFRVKLAAIQRRDPDLALLVQAVRDLHDVVEWIAQRAHGHPASAPPPRP